MGPERVLSVPPDSWWRRFDGVVAEDERTGQSLIIVQEAESGRLKALCLSKFTSQVRRKVNDQATETLPMFQPYVPPDPEPNKVGWPYTGY